MFAFSLAMYIVVIYVFKNIFPSVTKVQSVCHYSSRSFLMFTRVYVCFYFSERELTLTFAICRRPSVCLLSVCRL